MVTAMANKDSYGDRMFLYALCERYRKKKESAKRAAEALERKAAKKRQAEERKEMKKSLKRQKKQGKVQKEHFLPYTQPCHFCTHCA